MVPSPKIIGIIADWGVGERGGSSIASSPYAKKSRRNGPNARVDGYERGSAQRAQAAAAVNRA